MSHRFARGALVALVTALLLVGLTGCGSRPAALTVTVAPDPIDVAVGQFVTVTVTVTLGTSPVAKASVAFSMPQDFRAVVIPTAVTTNAQGIATVQIEGQAAGATQLTVTSGTASTTVTVNVAAVD